MATSGQTVVSLPFEEGLLQVVEIPDPLVGQVVVGVVEESEMSLYLLDETGVDGLGRGVCGLGGRFLIEQVATLLELHGQL